MNTKKKVRETKSEERTRKQSWAALLKQIK
jgi:hypothetical protein